MNGIPAAAAARAVASSASGCARTWTAIGAIASGQRGGLAEERRRRIDPRQVDQHARPEPPTTPRRLVLGEGDLVPRAAGDVVVGRRVHDRPCEGLEVRQPDGRRHEAPVRRGRVTDVRAGVVPTRPEEGQGPLEFVAQDREGALDAGLPAGASAQ